MRKVRWQGAAGSRGVRPAPVRTPQRCYLESHLGVAHSGLLMVDSWYGVVVMGVDWDPGRSNISLSNPAAGPRPQDISTRLAFSVVDLRDDLAFQNVTCFRPRMGWIECCERLRK